ncbi:MAG: serine/threonine-protein kinase [Planctomycetaceae bacterium]
MTNREDAPGADGLRDEHELAQHLDEYLKAWHSGDVEACQRLVEEYPSLSEFTDSLELLHELTPDLEFASQLYSLFSAGSAGPESPVGEMSGQTGPTWIGVADSGTARGQAGSGDDRPPAGVGTRFGRYLLYEELGRGGMGVVFRALQTDLDRVVAVKMILVNRLASPDDIRRFYQEAQAAGRLSHPSIVRIHEVGAVHGQHFFSMDCIEGLSLSGLLAMGSAQPDTVSVLQADDRSSHSRMPAGDGNPQAVTNGSERLPPDGTHSFTFSQAVRMLRDVARAAQYLHSQGIIHRDFKPSNILLDKSNQPFVTDFGLAKVFSSSSEDTDSGAIVGTPGYMSPEQAAGRLSEISPASDVYSLGAILYATLTGRPPHRKGTAMETVVSVIEADPELPRRINREVPHDLEAICLKCLEKDPQRRYASAESLADDLDRFLKGEPVLAKTEGRVQSVRRWARRNPALASRWGALLTGGAILQLSKLAGEASAENYFGLVVLLSLWFITAWIFQQLQRNKSVSMAARCLWLVSDAMFLTWMLTLARPPVGPLIIVYPMLIAAAGLFLHESLVLLMTSVSLASYAILLWLRPGEVEHWHYPLIFATVMIIIGCVTAHQVYRLRALNRHLDQR